MGDSDKVCDLCNYQRVNETYPQLNKSADHSRDIFFVECPNCGNFSLSAQGWSSINEHENKETILYRLSGLARELTDMGYNLEIIDSDLEDILSNPLIPISPMEKLNKLLQWFYRHTEYFGQEISICVGSHYVDMSEQFEHYYFAGGYTDKLYKRAICYAINDKEFISILEVAKENMYLNSISNDYYSLTLRGHEYCQQLSKTGANTNNAFVAMWFSNEVSAAYNKGIEPAIKECGYIPVRVDRKEHNNDITDEIISGIRDSKFVIADMTGYRGGVYFEAGYAKGLGKEVILTCRRDWFDGEKDNSGNCVKETIHFDVSHINTIVWDKPVDLQKRLIKRIKATIV